MNVPGPLAFQTEARANAKVLRQEHVQQVHGKVGTVAIEQRAGVE